MGKPADELTTAELAALRKVYEAAAYGRQHISCDAGTRDAHHCWNWFVDLAQRLDEAAALLAVCP